MLTFMPYYALILRTAFTDVYDSQDKAMSNKLKTRQMMCYKLYDRWPETNVGQVWFTRVYRLRR